MLDEKLIKPQLYLKFITSQEKNEHDMDSGWCGTGYMADVLVTDPTR
ncbi:hypothetical protein L313_0957 [Acinetobacter haemolyticus CIP 64.3 = MTCC 9819]|nr:hypothetical protein L313_0957 [Acinetobacter haemolyticus CIP 64.3 = MTCC 9819]